MIGRFLVSPGYCRELLDSFTCSACARLPLEGAASLSPARPRRRRPGNSVGHASEGSRHALTFCMLAQILPEGTASLNPACPRRRRPDFWRDDEGNFFSCYGYRSERYACRRQPHGKDKMGSTHPHPPGSSRRYSGKAELAQGWNSICCWSWFPMGSCLARHPQQVKFITPASSALPE